MFSIILGLSTIIPQVPMSNACSAVWDYYYYYYRISVVTYYIPQV